MADTDEKKAKAQGKLAKGKSDKGKPEQQAPRPQTAEQMAKAGKDDKKAAKQARSPVRRARKRRPSACSCQARASSIPCMCLPELVRPPGVHAGTAGGQPCSRSSGLPARRCSAKERAVCS